MTITPGGMPKRKCCNTHPYANHQTNCDERDAPSGPHELFNAGWNAAKSHSADDSFPWRDQAFEEFLERWTDSEPEGKVPKRVGHPDNPPVSPTIVLNAYVNLVESLDQFNAMVPPDSRVMVPFAIQEALVHYIGEQEAIASIQKTMNRGGSHE